MNKSLHENGHKLSGRRVVMLLENNPYPQDVRVRQEALSLSVAGYAVSVVCPSMQGQSPREAVDGVLVFRYPLPQTGSGFLGLLFEYAYSFVATFLLLLVICVRPGFDIIHSSNPPDLAVLIAGFYKVFGKKFVYDQHDLVPEMYLAHFEGRVSWLAHSVLIGLETLSLRLADHVIATNESYKALEMERGHVPAGRITIVRNGPDLRQLCMMPCSGGHAVNGKTTIDYVGTLGFHDGVDYLIRALGCLVRDLGRTDFCCLIVGRGDALESIKLLTERLGLSKYVSFIGWVEQSRVRYYLSQADICVAPEPSNSYNDRSTMIKIMEYMAFNKPTVAFDLPEHRVTAQGSALYAQPNDELDFARHIALLMDHRELRTEMGKIGRARIETELSWTHQEKQLLEAYRTLLATG